MKTEPTKLPMRKLIDFMQCRVNHPFPVNGKNFFEELLELAEELEVEELAMLGDAHYDGMCRMKELIESQDLLKTNSEYIQEKFEKELPDVDSETIGFDMHVMDKSIVEAVDTLFDIHEKSKQ